MKSISASLLVIILISLTACSPVYVMRAAYEQSKILAARRPLDKVIGDPQTNSEDRIKLLLVSKARQFSELLSLQPGQTFTTYTKLEKNPVAWVVSASRKDSFTPYTWWFPIVGSVPYRGYFDKQEALDAGASLELKGNEAWVRGTAAFSTLGWFNDPLLSSTLNLSTIDVVNTVIHETVHSTIWIPGSVAFNESLANYVGSRATIDFFIWLAGQEDSPLAEEKRQEYLNKSRLEFERELFISDSFIRLYSRLSEFYGSNLSFDEKLAGRDKILEEEFREFRSKYPGLAVLPVVNNAEIMQRKLYLSDLREFDRLFNQVDSDWTKFMKQIKNINQEAGQEEERIFALLKNQASDQRGK